MYIDVNSISIGPRQRKKIESQPLADLTESIRQKGLLHPPVYRKVPDSEVWQLVVGERRTRAMQNLIKDGVQFMHNGELVPLGMMPITTLQETLTRADRAQIEFDENKLREPLTWQEETEALAAIHKMRQEENPKQTLLATAQTLIAENAVDHTNAYALSDTIRRATAITENMDNPLIANARNPKEAYNLLVKADEEKVLAEIARRRIVAAPTQAAITIRHGDATQVLPTLDSNLADLIIADPPFGIGASGAGFRARSVHHHEYDDTPQNAREVAQAIIFDGFRVAKPMANMFIFCDVDLFPVLKEMAGRVGWVAWRTPLIWQKSLSEGMAPWQSKGPRRTYEMIFYATKGQKGLLASPVDVLTHMRVSRSDRTHAAEKPVDLLKRLIECSTLPGDFVLDPCCGSGSSLVAAKQTKRIGLGIEKAEHFYNTAMANVHKGEMIDDASDTTSSTDFIG